MGGPAHADEVADSHTQRMRHGRLVDGLGLWVAFEQGGEPTPTIEERADRFVGLMMLPPAAHGPDQPDDPTVADLGYRIVRRQWGRGLAREASAELLRHGFEAVGVRRVIAQTMAVNTRSRRVMEALGMRFVRRYHVAFDDPLPGTEEGEVEYAIDRRDLARPAQHAGLTASAGMAQVTRTLGPCLRAARCTTLGGSWWCWRSWRRRVPGAGRSRRVPTIGRPPCGSTGAPSTSSSTAAASTV